MSDALPGAAEAEVAPVLVVTAAGQGVRFVPTDVRAMGRTAGGVRAIKLAPGDRVAGAVVAPDTNVVLISHTSGAVKRVACSDFPVQGRAGKGVRASITGGRHGTVSLITLWTNDLLLQIADEWVPADVKMAPLASRDVPPSKSKLLASPITATL
jgi:DNA gyrase subunit A